MEKKALIVGVGNYRGYAADLEAAVPEARRWEKLLREKYGYATELLTDKDATVKDIRREVERLLKGAEDNYQLMLVLSGHGTVTAVKTSTGYTLEEAFCAFPHPGSTPRDSVITDSDLAAMFRDAHLPEDADTTLILETCFSGGFDIDLPPGAKRLFIQSTIDGALDLTNVRAFGSLGRGEAAIGGPLIVAACGRKEQAVQLEIDGEPRALFSSRALDWLRIYDGTFRDLLAGIQPLLKGIPQTPELRGDLSGADEFFPGEPTDAPTLSESDVATEIAKTATARLAAASIAVRFTGITCFADPNSGSTFAKRVLLPYDSRSDVDKKHIAFIEFGEDQVEQWTGVDPIAKPHVGGGIDFLRWHLQGHRIEFLNVDVTGGLATTAAYERYVPGMQKDILPSLDPLPDATCYLDPPPEAIVAAHVDLYAGILDAGTIDQKIVMFTNKAGVPGTWHRRTAEYAELRLPLTTAAATIRITKGSEETMIYLKPYASVLIGNAREQDILQDPLSSENPREHFPLFYLLARPSTVPSDPPLPWIVSVPVNFCSPAGWP